MNSWEHGATMEECSTTACAGCSWIARGVVYHNGEPVDDDLSKSTPSNAVLLAWAKKPENQPPQEWWDDEDDPFG